MDDIDGIIFIFQQMTSKEIEFIGGSEFDTLWNSLWTCNGKKNNTNEYEYKKSREKFYKLKNDSICKLNLNFYVKNVNPSWNHPEWGFPKGRRNYREIDLDCAIREFEEESGFEKKDYELMPNIEPLVEDFIGLKWC